MIYFIGAGPGAPDLITVRGAKLLEKADLVIYAGSLVNPALLTSCKADATILNSASMTLEEVVTAMKNEPKDSVIVRLHTGDPSLYGAICEQMQALDALGLAYEVVPGVSSFCGAAAALQKEFTPADGSQTLIVSRRAGRTPVPERENVQALASHGASMVFFLSAGMIGDLCRELIEGGYTPDTPAAVVYKATWPEQEVIVSTLAELPQKTQHIHLTALVTVGDYLQPGHVRSKLYDGSFAHLFRTVKP